MELNKLRVVHILSGLYQGGAESQLEKLISYSCSNSVEHIIISLKSDQTPLMQRFRDNNITVYSLGFSGRGSLMGFVRLTKLLNRLSSPETVVQCWMYHANLFGLLAASLVGFSKHVVWNIRRTELPAGATGILAKLAAKLSHRCNVNIICCAQAAKKSHILAGYNSKNMVVIHNGIDVELFKLNAEKALLFREEIGLNENHFIIGMVGRYAPIKGHGYLLKAFKLLLERLMLNNKALAKTDSPIANVKLVMIGRDISAATALKPLLSDPLLTKHLIIVPERNDIHQVMPAFNLLCLPSKSEGFPNVVAEAMACGVPALVTDVGDAAIIVNNNDMVIPSQNVTALAEKLWQAVNITTEIQVELKIKARERICNNFSIEKAWQNYRLLYQKVLHQIDVTKSKSKTIDKNSDKKRGD